MNYFWTHRDNIPEGLGFGQFSIAHLIWVLAMVAMTVLITASYKKSDKEGRIKIRRIIAIVLAVSEVIKLIAVARDGIDVTMYLPLEICSFAAYAIMLDSVWTETKFFGEMLLTLFLPAAIMSLLFPTVTPLPAINFFTIHQFVFHGLIVAYVVARFASGEIELNYPGVWKSIGKIVVVAAIVYIIDVKFNRTFMFLTDTYGNPLLDVIWNATGGGFAYTIGLVGFVIVVVHIFFLIFKAIEKIFHIR